jgi:hypothetical protein
VALAPQVFTDGVGDPTVGRMSIDDGEHRYAFDNTV